MEGTFYKNRKYKPSEGNWDFSEQRWEQVAASNVVAKAILLRLDLNWVLKEGRNLPCFGVQEGHTRKGVWHFRVAPRRHE